MVSSLNEGEEPSNSREEGHSIDANEEEEEREMQMQGTKREMLLQRMKREMLMQRRSNLNLLVNLGEERGQSPGG